MTWLRKPLDRLLSFLFCALTLSVSTAADSRRTHDDANLAARPTAPLLRQGKPTPAVYNTRFPGVTWDNNGWVLTSTNFQPGQYQSRMPNANGYLGINLASAGPFFEVDVPFHGDIINGWPLFNRRQTFATISGFWDAQPTTNGTNFPWLEHLTGETAISGIPHWGGIIVKLSNGRYLDATVNPMAISSYSTSQDLARGVSSWSYLWTPQDLQGVSFNIAYTLFTNKLYINQGVSHLEITPSQDCNVSIVNVLDGRCAVRTDFVGSGVDGQQIYTAVRPNGVGNVTAYVYAGMQASAEVDMATLAVVSNEPYIGANDSTIAQAAQASLKAGQTTTVTKFVGGASSDGFSDPQGQAKNASLKAMELGYEMSYIYTYTEWEQQVLPKTSADSYTFPENDTLPSDPNIIEAQIMAVVNNYYLLQQTISRDAYANVDGASINVNSISVCGLTSDCYAGLVFWDAEVWMQPGLVVSHPWAAKQIANYRIATYGQAKANVATAYTSSKNTTTFSENAAVYPWTSGRQGNCTGTGPCFDYEYHINADIVLEFLNYRQAAGDADSFFQQELFPIMDSLATFMSDLLVKNGSQYALLNMTDPDEYANDVSNGGFTMTAISNILTYDNMLRALYNTPQSTLFAEQAANVLISRDPETDLTLEYTGMNGSISVKQADVVLNTYPLDFSRNYTIAQKLNDLDYYAGKQSDAGPGMTYAIFSIDAAAVSPSGCSAYTYQQYSTRPYTRGPWFQFSEQLIDDYALNGGTHPAFPFLTGHGGANQVLPFAYLGLRMLPDDILHLDPRLPPQIPYITYRVMYWQGWPYQAASNQTATTITRLATPLDTANNTYATMPIMVQQGSSATFVALPPGGSITLLHSSKGNNIPTIPGNIAQCLPVSSPDSWMPGQFPLSAVDGAASTKWQPMRADIPQSITVDLSSQPYQEIVSLSFDWAQNPPVNGSVVFHNGTTPTAPGGSVVSLGNISISAPFVASETYLITPYQSNTTNLTVTGGVWSGRFATLTVQGNQGGEGEGGASVAEMAVVGRSRVLVGR
ncbi:hypothetical protein MMC19_003364 [Ptychographa xylographoides]|nr:hypothetical protein [Ptychographa xylographoides]